MKQSLPLLQQVCLVSWEMVCNTGRETVPALQNECTCTAWHEEGNGPVRYRALTQNVNTTVMLQIALA